jgi:hypothetical protein
MKLVFYTTNILVIGNTMENTSKLYLYSQQYIYIFYFSYTAIVEGKTLKQLKSLVYIHKWLLVYVHIAIIM